MQACHWKPWARNIRNRNKGKKNKAPVSCSLPCRIWFPVVFADPKHEDEGSGGQTPQSSIPAKTSAGLSGHDGIRHGRLSAPLRGCFDPDSHSDLIF